MRVSNAKYQKEEVICGWGWYFDFVVANRFLAQENSQFPKKFSIFVSNAEKFHRPKMISLSKGCLGYPFIRSHGLTHLVPPQNQLNKIGFSAVISGRAIQRIGIGTCPSTGLHKSLKTNPHPKIKHLSSYKSKKELVTSKTVDGRHLKEPPGVFLKPCK